MTKPQPCEFDHCTANPGVPGFRDALLTVRAPALPRGWRQSCVSCDLAPIVEMAEQPLEPQLRGEREPLDFAQNLCLQMIRQGTPVSGAKLLQACAPVPPDRIVIGDALAEQKPSNPVRMLNAFL